MSRYEFTCPECEQTIEVNESMRDATLTHGCPVCSADVTAADFAAEQRTN
ncbi:FmdB family zinc ribbon protein [Halostagnicola sp. A-GB9-2]|nr:FmdB family zinc ribbon protein [Halostagnicola sp. A-GB9-2]MDJ1433123.1 zinc ribbon domain-containing protein [Halostagnicola sp. A-GB9-2]